MTRFQKLRTVILFVVGLLGIFHETVIYAGEVRGELLITFSGMIGLTAFLTHDERRTSE